MDHRITRSDAISKTKQLSKLYRAAGREDCAAQSDQLIAKLQATLGHHIFLETEWFDHRLVAFPKNPRVKGRSLRPIKESTVRVILKHHQAGVKLATIAHRTSVSAHRPIDISR